VERSNQARLGERDHTLLAFAAQQRLVLAAHVQALLGVTAGAASARLRTLVQAGYLRYERKLAGPGCYLIERAGLRATGSLLPRPREVDLATYRHDVGMAWLWLAARRGAFGSLQAVVSERQMRSQDGRAESPEDRLGVRLPGPGPRGGERRHYPDLLLECSTGHRVAVELELTPKSRRRREEILGGYGINGRIDGVLYLVESRTMARTIERAAAACGISQMVHVQMVGLSGPARGQAPAREQNLIRSDGREP
jgi:hypothetical protein